MKKFASLLLALVMILGLAVPAFAAGTGTSTITITPSSDVITLVGRSFAAYKILDAQEVYVKEATGEWYQLTDGTYTKTAPADPASPTGYVVDSTGAAQRYELQYIYTVPTEWVNFFTGYFTQLTGAEADFDAQVVAQIATMTTNSDELHDFASAALKYAKDNGIAASGTDTVAEGETDAVITGLDMGYYVIEDTTDPANLDGTEKSETVSALMLDTTNATIVIKATTVTVDKNIIGGDDLKYTNGAIGDHIQFELKSNVPNMYGYSGFKFTIEDTLDKAISFVNEPLHPLVVKVGDTVLTEITDTTGYDPSTAAEGHNVYTLNVDETFDIYGNLSASTVITIDFPFIYGSGWTEDTPVTVTYYGKLNSNAVFTETGYPNEVKVEYSNKSNTDGQPTGWTTTKKVEVFTGEINLFKHDENLEALAGAIFTLEGTAVNQTLVTGNYYTADDNGTWYKLTTDGKYTQAVPTDLTKQHYETKTTDGSYQMYTLETKTELQTSSTSTTVTAEVASDGTLKFDGLAAGEYVITEIKAPAGYNLLQEPIYVKLDVVYTKDNAGETSAVWSLYAGEKQTDGTVNYDETQALTALTVNVLNQAGQELPETGGMGTTMFYVVGIAMMLGAIVLLATKKRMNNI